MGTQASFADIRNSFGPRFAPDAPLSLVEGTISFVFASAGDQGPGDSPPSAPSANSDASDDAFAALYGPAPIDPVGVRSLRDIDDPDRSWVFGGPESAPLPPAEIPLVGPIPAPPPVVELGAAAIPPILANNGSETGLDTPPVGVIADLDELAALHPPIPAPVFIAHFNPASETILVPETAPAAPGHGMAAPPSPPAIDILANESAVASFHAAGPAVLVVGAGANTDLLSYVPHDPAFGGHGHAYQLAVIAGVSPSVVAAHIAFSSGPTVHASHA